MRSKSSRLRALAIHLLALAREHNQRRRPSSGLGANLATDLYRRHASAWHLIRGVPGGFAQ
jgi:hypothetical protein